MSYNGEPAITHYSSDSYRIDTNEAGTEVTNLHTGCTVWLTDAEAAEAVQALTKAADGVLARFI